MFTPETLRPGTPLAFAEKEEFICMLLKAYNYDVHSTAGTENNVKATLIQEYMFVGTSCVSRQVQSTLLLQQQQHRRLTL